MVAVSDETSQTSGGPDAFIDATMLAARFDRAREELRMEEIPVPVPGPTEVLIRVHAAGVCLSDVHIIDGSLRGYETRDGQTVVTIGHEVSGTIAAIGVNVPPIWKLGDRVCLWAGDRCETCPACLFDTGWCLRPMARGVSFDGGWAEYALTHHRCLVAVPDNVPFEQAAIIPDAVSTPYQAVVRGGRVGPGTSVGIWGAGGLGYHAIRIARLAGGSPIIAIDPLPAARDRALTAGADLALDPADPGTAEAIQTATGGLGLDAALDFVGHPSVRASADDLMGPLGRLILVGMSAHPIHFDHAERFNALQHEVIGSWGSEPKDLHTLVRLAATGRLSLSESVSEVLPLAQAPEAVNRLANKEGNPIRIVLKP
jgi:D-arabinose 1-dehydrogenase-like Zn-dependent alcohol dehydrogenase